MQRNSTSRLLKKSFKDTWWFCTFFSTKYVLKETMQNKYSTLHIHLHKSSASCCFFAPYSPLYFFAKAYLKVLVPHPKCFKPRFWQSTLSFLKKIARTFFLATKNSMSPLVFFFILVVSFQHFWDVIIATLTFLSSWKILLRYQKLNTDLYEWHVAMEMVLC